MQFEEHHRARDFSIEEVERLGRALAPHFRLVVREELEPVTQEIGKLKASSRLWGAVTGALVSIGTALINAARQ